MREVQRVETDHNPLLHLCLVYFFLNTQFWRCLATVSIANMKARNIAQGRLLLSINWQANVRKYMIRYRACIAGLSLTSGGRF